MTSRHPFIPVKIASLCGIIGPIIALTNIIIAIMLSPWFSWASNALSDLGISPAAIFFNNGLIIAGIFLIIFALGFIEHLKGQVLTRLGTVIFIFACISLIMIGIFTEAYGVLHFYVSVAFFVLFPLGILVIAFSFLSKQVTRQEGVLTLIIAVAAFVTWLIPWGMGIAVPEMIASVLGSSWVIFFSIRFYNDTNLKSPKNPAPD